MRRRLFATDGQTTSEFSMMLGLLLVVAVGFLAVMQPTIRVALQDTAECVISDVCRPSLAVAGVPASFPGAGASGGGLVPLPITGDPTGPLGCAGLERQLQRDKEALLREQKTIAMESGQIDEAVKESQEAQREALRAGLGMLLGGLGDVLEQEAKATRTFLDFVQDRNIPLYLIQNHDARPLVQKAYEAYVNASAIARSAHTLKGASDAIDLWSLFEDDASAIASAQADGESALKDFLGDPAVRAYFQADDDRKTALANLESSLVTLTAQTATVERWATKSFGRKTGAAIGPAAELASFLVEYTYDMTEWYVSRKEILQQSSLSDEELKAVRALIAQIECTVKKLKQCRSGVPVEGCTSRISSARTHSLPSTLLRPHRTATHSPDLTF